MWLTQRRSCTSNPIYPKCLLLSCHVVSIHYMSYMSWPPIHYMSNMSWPPCAKGAGSPGALLLIHLSWIGVDQETLDHTLPVPRNSLDHLGYTAQT